jgi:hypothetical protein
LLQRTAAATAAWVIAKHVVGNHDPFFAPLAAVVALNAPLGERGLNAMRLLFDVVVGIVVGELTNLALGDGYASLALATFAAMAIARILGGARVMIAQAAAGAILTVTTAGGDVGTQRLVDALIGGGVALVFSQVFFSPEPVSLLRSAEAAVLAGMADGLELTTRALEREDDKLGERAVNELRDLVDRLAELARLRHASSRTARHSAVWRSHLALVVREEENAGHLDLLVGSCLLLARTAMATSLPERRLLAPSVGELADALASLAKDLGHRPTRQGAADQALDVARRLVGTDVSTESALTAAIVSARMVAADVMVFAGVEPWQAREAVQAGIGTAKLRVPAPPPRPPTPFNWRRLRPRR